MITDPAGAGDGAPLTSFALFPKTPAIMTAKKPAPIKNDDKSFLKDILFAKDIDLLK